MAAIITTTSDGQYIDSTKNVFGGVLSATQTYEDNGVVHADRSGAQLEIYPVNGVATTETLNFGPGIIAVAWQANDLDADRASCFLSNQANGTVTFSEAETGSIEGWVWVLRGGGGVNS